MGSIENKDDLKTAISMEGKVKPNENTAKLKILMRQLSDQAPIMNGGSKGSLASRYTKIVFVVALYW